MHIFTQLSFFPIVIGDVGGAVVETAERAAAAEAVALLIAADVVAAITVHAVVVEAAIVLVLTEAV